jgi:hypothetical protein
MTDSTSAASDEFRQFSLIELGRFATVAASAAIEGQLNFAAALNAAAVSDEAEFRRIFALLLKGYDWKTMGFDSDPRVSG